MPSQPNVSLSAASASSITVTVSGDAGVTNQIYTRDVSRGGQSDVLGPTISGNGSATVTFLANNGSYMVWVVAYSTPNQYSLPGVAFISLATTGTTLLALATALFQSLPALTSLFPGGLFANEVPESLNNNPLSLPWVVVRNGRTRTEWVMNAVFYEITALEFTIYCAGAAQAESCLAALRSGFDWVQLASHDGSVTSSRVEPVRYGIESVPVRYRDGSLIYTADITYDVWLNRSHDFPT